MKIKKVILDGQGIRKIIPGDQHGGGVTVLVASEKVKITAHELGGILIEGTRTVRLPEHRVLEIEYEPAPVKK